MQGSFSRVLQLVRGTGGRVGGSSFLALTTTWQTRDVASSSTLPPSGLSRLYLFQQDQLYCRTLILLTCTPNFIQNVIDLNARLQIKTELIDLCILWTPYTSDLLISFWKEWSHLLVNCLCGYSSVAFRLVITEPFSENKEIAPWSSRSFLSLTV